MGRKRNISQEFKEDALRYQQDHSELSIPTVATNLGISTSALRRWIEIAKKSNGTIESRGSGNYASEDAKEIARLRRELRNKEDALEVLKKAIGILGDGRSNLYGNCGLC